jgi:hypothetical protein
MRPNPPADELSAVNVMGMSASHDQCGVPGSNGLNTLLVGITMLQAIKLPDEQKWAIRKNLLQPDALKQFPHDGHVPTSPRGSVH